MIYGIGIDLIEIERIQTMLERQKRLPEKILSADELEKFNSFSHEKRKAEFLAGRFACKEAFSKALGTGIGKRIGFKAINCKNDELGRPYIEYEGFKVHVSISHTENYATSQVILEKI
ncbi:MULTISPECIES: holo-ACP synthase [Staphylococcus]|uniref:holo-ACP synthase n=1 Tax=Staphylococcus TaxID=1279 RepID=UPI000DF72677|nr:MULTISPECIES: holo-ACP synthase [unclassified Staphylococcus]UXV35818.1 holo-ACP synthase [Staphylococcus sp. IVB6181]